jgi:hypothetical protein
MRTQTATATGSFMMSWASEQGDRCVVLTSLFYSRVYHVVVWPLRFVLLVVRPRVGEVAGELFPAFIADQRNTACP